MAGWSSANKYALLGGLRVGAQLMAYELPLVLAAASVAMAAGTLSLAGIAQRGSWWWLPYQGVGAVVFFVAGAGRAAPAAVRHAGRRRRDRLRPLHRVHRAAVRAVPAGRVRRDRGASARSPRCCSSAAGGARSSTPSSAGCGLLVKTLLLAFVVIWVRVAYPRLREDQLQRLAWQVLVPLALVAARPHRRRPGGDVMSRAIPGRGLATGPRRHGRGRWRTPLGHREYPDVKPELPPRSRGVIGLLEENCTCCMLCARECPDWCIYIDSHKETSRRRPRAAASAAQRARPVRDRLLALHVLRHLHRGLPVRRAVLVAGVRVRRDSTSATSPTRRTGCASGCATVPPPPGRRPRRGAAKELATATGEPTAASRGRREARPAPDGPTAPMTLADAASSRCSAVVVLAVGGPRRDDPQRRPRRAVAGRHPRRARRLLPGADRRVRRLGAGADLRRRRRRAAAVRR